MSNANYKKYCWYSLAVAVAVSIYPLYMGISVITKMVQNGAVPIEEYPKYIIPYTPIAIALIVGVLLIPLFQRLSRKLDLLFGSITSIAVFFLAERIMETKVLVQTQELIPLESWQMSLCYIPPEQFETRTWEAVDVLLGGYSPAFKIHFYLISVVIIVSLLNCFYGIAKMIRTGDHSRKKALVVQTITSAAFLGMCIWACFTAFYRTGQYGCVLCPLGYNNGRIYRVVYSGEKETALAGTSNSNRCYSDNCHVYRRDDLAQWKSVQIWKWVLV